MTNYLLEFLTQEHNINNFELGLFVIAGASYAWGGWIYYLSLSFLALGLTMYRDYNKYKLKQYNDIIKNKY